MAIGATILLTFALAGTIWPGNDAVQQVQNWEDLRRDGIEVVGNVTRTEMGKSLMIYYAFTVNGISFAGKATAPKQLLQSLKNSDPLPIRYVPTNPAVNHPANWESAPLDSIWFMAPVPLVLFGIVFLISLRRERQLVAEGLLAVGVITECGYGKGGYTVKYKFYTEDGKVRTRSVGLQGPLEIGSNIRVLYLRQNSRRNQPYPSPNYHVSE